MTDEHNDGAESVTKKRERSIIRDDSVPVQDFPDIFRVVAMRSKAGFDKVHDEISKLYQDAAPASDTNPNWTRKSKAKWWSSQPKTATWASTGSMLESSFKSYITDTNEKPKETSESDVEEYTELGNKIRRLQTSPVIQDNETKLDKIARGSLVRPPRSADYLKADTVSVDLPLSAGNVKPKKSVFNFDGVSDFMEDDMIIRTIPPSSDGNNQISNTEDEFYEVPPMEIREVKPEERFGTKSSAKPASELTSIKSKTVPSSISDSHQTSNTEDEFYEVPPMEIREVKQQERFGIKSPARTFPSSNSENNQTSNTEDEFYEVPPMEIREIKPQERFGIKSSAKPASELIGITNQAVLSSSSDNHQLPNTEEEFYEVPPMQIREIKQPERFGIKSPAHSPSELISIKNKTVSSSHQTSNTENEVYEVPPMEIREVKQQERLGIDSSARPASELIRQYNKTSLHQSKLKQFREGSQYGRFPVRSTISSTNEGTIRDQVPKPTTQTSKFNAGVLYDVPMKAAIKVTHETTQDQDDYDVPIKEEIKVTKDTKPGQRFLKPNKHISKDTADNDVSKRQDLQTTCEQPDYDTIPVKSTEQDDIYDVPNEVMQTTKPKDFMHNNVPMKPKHRTTNADVQHKRIRDRPAVHAKPGNAKNDSVTNQSTLKVTHEEVDYDEIPQKFPSVQCVDTNYENVTEKVIKKKKGNETNTDPSTLKVTHEEVDYDEIPQKLPSVQCVDTNYENVTEKVIKKKKGNEVVTIQMVQYDTSSLGNKQCNTKAKSTPKSNSAMNRGKDTTAHDSDEDYLDMEQGDNDYVNTSAFAKHKLDHAESDTPIYMEPDVNHFKK